MLTTLLCSQVLLALALVAAAQESGRQKPIAYQYGAMEWVDSDRGEPEGTHYHTFHGKTIDAEVSYRIYLPPHYRQQESTRYEPHIGSAITRLPGAFSSRPLAFARRLGPHC